jgi:hypothetical protein
MCWCSYNLQKSSCNCYTSSLIVLERFSTWKSEVHSCSNSGASKLLNGLTSYLPIFRSYLCLLNHLAEVWIVFVAPPLKINYGGVKEMNRVRKFWFYFVWSCVEFDLSISRSSILCKNGSICLRRESPFSWQVCIVIAWKWTFVYLKVQIYVTRKLIFFIIQFLGRNNSIWFAKEVWFTVKT